ncbi:MAG: paraquat-inducible protein A [Alphaproteobacteria bacterium]|nr:paraquat-inducible protein A [Alphaproteobacteria bacterium]
MPIIACHECAAVHRVSEMANGNAAICSVCGAMLYRAQRDSIERTLCFVVTALILFAIANLLPFMTFKLEGREQVSTIMTGVIGLYEDGMWPLALLVFAAAIMMPLLKLVALLYVLLPLHFERLPWGLPSVFRWIETIHPWAMMEVFLLGVIVAYVKLTDLATIELGLALFAFVAVIILMIAADVALDPRQVWERIAPQASDRLLQQHDSRTLVSCHACDQLYRLHDAGHPVCARCGAALHKRIPDSIAIGWALTIAACILYIPANLLPIMTVIHFGQGEPSTILSGVVLLAEIGMWPVAALVFFASVVVPVLKLVCMIFLMLSVQRQVIWRPRDRTLLYRIVEAVGRWSMVDIFMISILVALVSLGSIATIEPGAGAVAFAAVVIITMIAATAFDSRLIWDVIEREGDDDGQLIRA